MDDVNAAVFALVINAMVKVTVIEPLSRVRKASEVKRRSGIGGVHVQYRNTGAEIQ
ncbi:MULTISPECIES: hypothetical protein [Nocardiaceae]|uniref:hypothetical protein n=1 Tax=Nocardiaceae TaxID=85025 RepID=UPI0012D2F643|nr:MULTISPECIES: hypothetical protein [Rhodococcus]